MKNEHYSILIVDNDGMGRQLLQKELEAKGYTVATARNGEQALATAGIEQFDLIILDSTMTAGRGELLIDQLQQEPTTGDIPLFVILNPDDGIGRDGFLERGARCCFTRPLQMPGLLETIQKTLESLGKHVRPQKPKVAKPIKPSYSVLVVDDEEANRDLLSKRLVRDGYLVATAASGNEALKRLKERRYDLILLDIMMPGMDGFEALNQIKAEVQWRNIPVIMLTALHTIESVQQCKTLGADDYVIKPFNFARLREKIRACLGIIH